MTKPTRAIALIAGLVIVLVVVAIVAVLAFAPSKSNFTAGSPEDVFQRYITAYQNRDFPSAYGFFSTRAQQQLSLDEFTSYASSQYVDRLDRNSRIVVNRVEGNDIRKTLYLSIENVSGSGLDLNRWSYDVVVPMVQESGAWKIDTLLLGTSPAPIPAPTK